MSTPPPRARIGVGEARVAVTTFACRPTILPIYFSLSAMPSLHEGHSTVLEMSAQSAGLRCCIAPSFEPGSCFLHTKIPATTLDQTEIPLVVSLSCVANGLNLGLATCSSSVTVPVSVVLTQLATTTTTTVLRLLLSMCPLLSSLLPSLA